MALFSYSVQIVDVILHYIYWKSTTTAFKIIHQMQPDVRQIWLRRVNN